MTETITSRRRLGRGLEALLGPTRAEAQREGSLVELAIADSRPNPYQPRRDVDPAQLEELTASIRKAGLLQPVVVRPAPAGSGGFELLVGARSATWVAKEAVEVGLAERDGEERVRGGRAPVRRGRLKKGQGQAPEVRRIERALRGRLGTDVRVTLPAKGKGQLHVNFYSNDDLARTSVQSRRRSASSIRRTSGAWRSEEH